MFLGETSETFFLLTPARHCGQVLLLLFRRSPLTASTRVSCVKQRAANILTFMKNDFSNTDYRYNDTKVIKSLLQKILNAPLRGNILQKVSMKANVKGSCPALLSPLSFARAYEREKASMGMRIYANTHRQVY